MARSAATYGASSAERGSSPAQPALRRPAHPAVPAPHRLRIFTLAQLQQIGGVIKPIPLVPESTRGPSRTAQPRPPCHAPIRLFGETACASCRFWESSTSSTTRRGNLRGLNGAFGALNYDYQPTPEHAGGTGALAIRARPHAAPAADTVRPRSSILSRGPRGRWRGGSPGGPPLFCPAWTDCRAPSLPYAPDACGRDGVSAGRVEKGSGAPKSRRAARRKRCGRKRALARSTDCVTIGAVQTLHGASPLNFPGGLHP